MVRQLPRTYSRPFVWQTGPHTRTRDSLMSFRVFRSMGPARLTGRLRVRHWKKPIWPRWSGATLMWRISEAGSCGPRPAMMSDAILSAAAGSRSNQVAASGEKMKRRIAVVGTGGSIATLGRSPFDLIDYGRFGRLLPIEQLLGLFPDLNGLADLVPVAFDTIHSEAVGPADWVALAKQVMDLQSGDLRVDGTVVVHGTSTLEESAWVL